MTHQTSPISLTRPARLLTVGMLCAFGLAACKTETPSASIALQPVLVSVVGVGQNSQQRSFSAVIAARDSTPLAFRASGKVLRRMVEVGQRVEKGQALATLDPTDYQLAVAAASDQLRAASVDATQQRLDAERLQRLLKDESVGKADYERQRTRANAAQALEEQASRQLQLTKNRVDYTTLVAPYSGVVTSLSFEAGQVVAEGQPVLGLASSGEVDVVVDLPEAVVGQLRNMRAQVSLWNQSEQRYPVQLRELAPMANPQTGTFTARFRGAPNQWRLGMTAQLQLDSANSKSSSILPASALMQTTDQRPFVWQVVGEKVQKVPVKIESYQENSVEVSGLNSGDQIVSVGAQKLDEKSRVRAIVRDANARAAAEQTDQPAATQNDQQPSTGVAP